MSDLITTKAKFLCNICDCVSIGNKGDPSALNIFQNYPYSNCYLNRLAIKKSDPGTVQIKGDGKKNRYVINIFGQYYPGSPKYPNDNITKRMEWFEHSLTKLIELDDLESLAFPRNLGVWEDFDYNLKYINMIDDFQRKYFLAHEKSIRIVDYNDEILIKNSELDYQYKYETPISIIQTKGDYSDECEQVLNIIKSININDLKYIMKTKNKTMIDTTKNTTKNTTQNTEKNIGSNINNKNILNENLQQTTFKIPMKKKVGEK